MEVRDGGCAVDMLIFDSALQERQQLATRLLGAALTRKSLANAYLLTGRAMADKWLLARQTAAFLNCLSRSENDFFSCLSQAVPPEKTCQNCNWIASGEHPQAWLLLEGQGESQKIPVEKARQLTDELGKTSRYMRVIIIPHAEQDCLHMAPANALLKNIEEPQDNTVFIMFAASHEQVLPTIVSRSQVLPVINKFSRGLWLDETESKSSEPSKLEMLKSEFIHAARNRLSGHSSMHGSFLKEVSESHDLSNRLLDLSEEEELEPEILIDVLCAAELEVLRESAAQNRSSEYLSKLMELSESSKQQLNHYVRKNNVLETFAYSLTELRLKHLGDLRLAK